MIEWKNGNGMDRCRRAITDDRHSMDGMDVILLTRQFSRFIQFYKRQQYLISKTKGDGRLIKRQMVIGNKTISDTN